MICHFLGRLIDLKIWGADVWNMDVGLSSSRGRLQHLCLSVAATVLYSHLGTRIFLSDVSLRVGYSIPLLLLFFLPFLVLLLPLLFSYSYQLRTWHNI